MGTEHTEIKSFTRIIQSFDSLTLCRKLSNRGNYFSITFVSFVLLLYSYKQHRIYQDTPLFLVLFLILALYIGLAGLWTRKVFLFNKNGLKIYYSSLPFWKSQFLDRKDIASIAISQEERREHRRVSSYHSYYYYTVYLQTHANKKINIKNYTSSAYSLQDKGTKADAVALKALIDKFFLETKMHSNI